MRSPQAVNDRVKHRQRVFCGAVVPLVFILSLLVSGCESSIKLTIVGGNKIAAGGVTPIAVSADKADGKYNTGDSIAIQVSFSDVVFVKGIPLLTLETGSTDAIVDYSSGSGTKMLTFNYTVASGHSSSDLDYVSTSALALNSGTIKDSSGNPVNLTLPSPGETSSLGANKALVINAASSTSVYSSSSPAVTISSTATASTNSSPIPVSVTFSMAVTGFVAGDVTLTNGTISGFAGSGTNYTFNVTPTGQGTVAVNIAAAVAISASSVANTAAAPLTRIFDSVGPTVTLTSASSASVNGAYSVTATFSESATGFVVGDIVVGNGTAGNFAGSGATYTFDVTPTAAGAVTVNVAAGVAVDAATNNNTIATQLSRTYDYVAPTVALSSAAGATINAAFTVTATFSESVTGFVIGDIVVGNGTAGNFAGSGTTYTFDVTPIAAGAVTVDVAAGVAADAATNNNTVATQLSRTYDNVAPTVALSSASTSPLNSTFTVTATFSESVTGFVVGDITVGNGTAGTFSGSGTTYTFIITPTAAGAVTVDVASSVAADAGTNSNSAATQLSRTYDNVAPTATMSSGEATPTRNAAIAVTVTISETTVNFTSADLTLGNATISGFAGSGTSYSFTLIPSGQGAVTVDIAGSTFTDAAGNNNTAASQFSRTYDTVPPPVPTAAVCTGSENSVATSWTTGGGDTAGYLVVRRYGSSPSWTPTNGTTYVTTPTPNLDDYTHWLAYVGATASVTETDVYPGMPHYYAIYAYDSVLNYQAALTTNCSPEVMVMLENLPATTYSGGALNIKVGGQNVTQYQYALTTPNFYCDEATYSGWIAVGTNITSTPVRGHYRLCVKGRNASNVAQTTASEYYFLKTAHTSVDWPSRWGSKVQQGDYFRIRWEDHNAADDASGTLSFYYAAAITSADCSTAISIAPNVSQNTASKWQNWDTTAVATGTYYICVESYDGSAAPVSYWSEGTVTVENYCTGATLTNTLTSNNNGTGASGNPYNICTLTQLDEFRTMTQINKYFQLRRDIDASSTSGWNAGAGWDAGTFDLLKFDGNGYVIRGLFISRSGTQSIGLFGLISSTAAVIINTRLEDVNITGGLYTGGIMGDGTATISQSYVSGAITSNSNTVGGIAGRVNSPGGGILTCKSTASVSGTGTVGGIVGYYVRPSLTKLWATGAVNSSTGNIGGIAGASSGNYLTFVLFTGSVANSATGSSIGGVIGGTTGAVISRAINVGPITAIGSNVGGIVGLQGNSLTILNSVNTGSVSNSAAGAGIGGIIGYSWGNSPFHMIGSINTGSVTASLSMQVGGLVGWKIISGNTGQHWTFASYSTGNISGSTAVGGMLGESDSKQLVQGCFSTGSVTCSTSNHCGGGFGYVYGGYSGLIDNYATGSVLNNRSDTNSGNYAAGYIGFLNNAIVKNSYATGNVSRTNGTYNVGGFGGLGQNSCSVANSFSTGIVAAGTSSAGFWQTRSTTPGAFTNVYWYKPGGNTQNCVYSDSASGSTSCSTDTTVAYFQNSSNAPLSSWDFTNMWKIPTSGGYPILSWQHDY